MKKMRKAEGMLLVVSVIWGAGFTLSKNALSYTNPMSFTFFRFGVAFLFLCGYFLVFEKRIPISEWNKGFFSGMLLFFAIMLQTVALRYTDASRVAFIAGLNCVLVPFFSSILNRKAPPKNAFFGALFSASGLLFLCGNIDVAWNIGDTIAVCAAVLFASQIIAVTHESRQTMPQKFVFSELLICAAFSLVFAHFFRERNTDFTSISFWSGVLITGLFCTAGAFFIQGRYQKETSPTKAAVIFATEPGFGLLFSLVVPNYLGEVEKLYTSQVAGCFFLLLGILISSLPEKNKKYRINT